MTGAPEGSRINRAFFLVEEEFNNRKTPKLADLAQIRIQMHEHLPPGISIAKSENLEEWQMDIRVLDDNPLYKDEIYRLKFTFTNKYPIG